MKICCVLFIFCLVQIWKTTAADFQRDSFISVASLSDDGVLSRSKRQSEGSSSRERVTSTDICNENQYEEFVSDLGVCYENSITKFLDVYDFDGSTLANERVTCNKFKDQAK